jgi:hypothetical protein
MIRKTIVLALLLLAAGCKTEAPTEDVDKAATLFFERLKAAQYEDIYTSASQQFKDSVAKATILDNLQQINSMGRIQVFKRLQMPFEDDEKGRIVSPVYGVIFDQMTADITVNFKDEGGEWKLVGFQVKPRRTS